MKKIITLVAIFGIAFGLLALSGCMSASQKYDLATREAVTRDTLAQSAPSVIRAATSIVSCGIDINTMMPIVGANCTGLYVQIGAGQDELQAVATAITPPRKVGGGEATRDIGVALVQGITSPVTMITGLGMYGIKHAGDDKSNRVVDSSSDSNSNSFSVDRSGNTVTLDKVGNTSTVGDMTDFGNQKDAYGSGNMAGGNQGVVNESPASVSPTIDFSPAPAPVVLPVVE
jgi:hypothetical protein